MIKDFRPGPDSDQERALESVAALRRGEKDDAGTLAMLSGINAASHGISKPPEILAQHEWLTSRWKDGHGYGVKDTKPRIIKKELEKERPRYWWQKD